MPVVPVQTTPTVGTSPGSAQFFSAPDSGNAAGKQLESIGQATERAGLTMDAIAADAQDQADRVRVIDAKNRLAEAQFDLLYDRDRGALFQKGQSALQRESGTDLATETGDKLKEIVAEISKTLGNEHQRSLFEAHAGNVSVQMHGTVLHHIGSEFQSYTAASYDGALSEAQRQIGMFGVTGNVPDGREPGTTAIDDHVADITAAVREKARLVGLPQTAADEAVQADVSKAYAQAIEGALQAKNPAFAGDLFKQGLSAGRLVPGDILRLRGSITNADHSQISQAAVSTVTSEMRPAFMPDDMDRIVGITAGTESGGKDYGKNGAPVVSPKGAMYMLQVTPPTAKDPGNGVVPAKDDSPEEYNRVGRDLIGALLKRYDGDPAKMWAAYNSGTGKNNWVDQAISRASGAEAGTKEADWLWQLNNDARNPENRKETDAYVAKNMTAFRAGRGAGPMPSKLQFVDAAVAKLGGNPDPELLQRTQQQAEHQYGLLSAELDQRRTEEATSVSLAIINAKTPAEANAAITATTDPHIKLLATKLAGDWFAMEKPKAEFDPVNVGKAAQLRELIDNKAALEIPGNGDDKPISLPLDSAANVAMAASAMGIDNANRGELIKYFEQGGLVGKIKAADVNRSFTLYTGKEPKDAPEAYDYVLKEAKRVLVLQGKEPNEDAVNSAVKQALLTFGSKSKPAGPGIVLTVGKSEKAERESAYAEKFGITEQVVNMKIKESGAPVSSATQNAWLRTWNLDIPPSFKSRAEKVLKENGKQVNETTIRMLYIQANEPAA